MKSKVSFLLFVVGAVAHGGHEHSGPEKGETIQQYAQRHMSSEHHIDTFDLQSFFHLHDLNRDGVWDKEEIEAIYGVHHVYSQKKSKDDIEHQKKANAIVTTVLAKIDSNVDGKISQEEFAAVGLGGLPNFDHMGAEGHHYDVESEFFLHHEEQFHSTPETQTDESYTHPEDAEHFAAHAKIEQREAEREAKFIGITVEEALKQHEQPHAPEEPKVADQQVAPQDPLAAHPHDEQVSPQEPLQEPPRARQKLTRVTPPEKQAPEVKYKDARASGAKKGEWGTGEGGYKPPVEPGDKMRRNLPYKNTRMKYKFKRNWGDF